VTEKKLVHQIEKGPAAQVIIVFLPRFKLYWNVIEHFLTGNYLYYHAHHPRKGHENWTYFKAYLDFTYV